MRIICMGPSLADDAKVFNYVHKRLKVMGNPLIVPAEATAEEIERIRQEVRTSSGEFEHRPEDEFSMISSEPVEAIPYFPLGTDRSEEELLDGTWASVRNFHDTILPLIRAKMASLARELERSMFHIDLGKSFAMLYAAYFAAIDGYTFGVTFHAPLPDEHFNIGGFSVYARHRPLIRRYLASTVLRKAESVFVDDKTVLAALGSLFPNCRRPVFADPLSAFALAPEEPALSSPPGDA